jgi:hypothetical protein
LPQDSPGPQDTGPHRSQADTETTGHFRVAHAFERMQREWRPEGLWQVMEADPDVILAESLPVLAAVRLGRGQEAPLLVAEAQVAPGLGPADLVHESVAHDRGQPGPDPVFRQAFGKVTHGPFPGVLHQIPGRVVVPGEEQSSLEETGQVPFNYCYESYVVHVPMEPRKGREIDCTSFHAVSSPGAQGVISKWLVASAEGCLATLHRVGTRVTVALEPEHTVGRSPECRLIISAPYVSAQHALLRWSGYAWEARDLGSTNGTWLDGERLRTGEARRLERDSVLAFGHLDQRWQLSNIDAPQSLLVPLDGGLPIVIRGTFQGLPSAENPEATLFQDGAMVFRLEGPDGAITPLAADSVVEVAGRRYRLSPALARARTEVPRSLWTLRTVRLTFGVTRDEEHVEIEVDDEGDRKVLPARASYYTLLFLARRRIADATQGHPESACGWVFKDEILSALDLSPTQLNLEIFRIREQFCHLGIGDSGQIIERRSTTKQLRIGAGKLEIRRL